MVIGRFFDGLPKLTFRLNSTAHVSSPLTDSHSRFHNYLRMSLTERCNLRCQYCMPADGVQLTPKQNLLNLDERKRLISIFAGLGVTKLRFTGGEPTISKDLVDLIIHARSIPSMDMIGMTTNGITLSSQLDRLTSAGLSSVNISLDSMDAGKYSTVTRRDKKFFYKVLSSMYAAVTKNIKVKLNCVVMRGTNEDELYKFVELTREFNVDVRFIELMPFDQNDWNSQKLVTYLEMIDHLENNGIVLTKILSGDRNDTTKWYTCEGGVGRVGFITSMSSNFCGTCNRLRITADGKLKVCLFGDESYSLLDSMRAGYTDNEIVAEIGKAVRRKQMALGGLDGPDLKSPDMLAKQKNRPMILIGG